MTRKSEPGERVSLFEDDNEWRYERFITTIQQKAGISWDEAERAARATLLTLGERLSSGQARDIANDLPDELGAWLRQPGGDSQGFGVIEFVRRVADREDVDTDTAERHARAAFIALARLVRGDEIEDLAAELPKEYATLLGDAMQRSRDPAAPEALPLEELLDRVEGRAGLDRAGARRAVEAVLETLAERIAEGEADDVAKWLPEELRPALERGKARSPKAQRMSLDEFIRRVAEREGIAPEVALDHARAVFATLREALPAKELSDVLAELPRGYQEALV
jgi:uncharacterized protein (DUF2267 family)